MKHIINYYTYCFNSADNFPMYKFRAFVKADTVFGKRITFTVYTTNTDIDAVKETLKKWLYPHVQRLEIIDWKAKNQVLSVTEALNDLITDKQTNFEKIAK